ncbi:hypothetical protein B0H16DRAFT_1472669 [Mycena metata]|uniref:Uncharacterized protein n=1 Tax=Mycena metata TaxID=1033252 RepID=A0AAD7HM86_9AGAR|nr:hypothetical protein B0H16DRAFT_1472669 [Mycena metata]
MALDPEVAIDRLLAAFAEYKDRLQRLENTLAREVLQTTASAAFTELGQRREADEALSEAKANGVLISLAFQADITTLRQEIRSLKEAAVQREQEVAEGSNEWRKKLSGTLEAFNKNHALAARYHGLEETIQTLRDENSELKNKLARASAEAVKRDEEEDDDEPPENLSNLRKQYSALEIQHKELQRAFSEVNAAQEDRVLTSMAHERLALEAAEQALEELQAQYDALASRKKRKAENIIQNSDEVKTLTAQVAKLTADLAKVTKLEFDKLSATSLEVNQKLRALQKERGESTDLNKKYDKLQAEREELKAKCAELEERNTQLHQTNKNLWTERNHLEQTCGDAIEAAETMDTDAQALRRNIASLREDCRSLEGRLEKTNNVNSAFRNRIQTSVARVLYDDFMATFPSSLAGRPDFASLQPIAKTGTDLPAYFASIQWIDLLTPSQDSVCAGYVDRILYMPRRTISTSDTRLHALAFSPTERYNPTRRSWSVATEIPILNGHWRELFVDVGDWVIYAGTYRCHDLRYLCPGGTPPPELVSSLEMLRAANLWELEPADRTRAINALAPSGILPADCLGLQCIGFNTTLYEALKRRSRGTKREADEVESGLPAKRQHLGQ